MSDYIFVNGEMYSLDELQHHGVKGMKWGVRRYQNPDGSLTAAGKKRMAKQITSSKMSVVGAEYHTRKNINSVKEFKDFKNSAGYQNALSKVNDYREYSKKHFKKYDAIRSDACVIAAKKYGGTYDELERRSDREAMTRFSNFVNSYMNKRGYKESERILEQKRVAALDARERIRQEGRRSVETLLGKHGNTKLKGQGSAIYRGGKIVDRLSVNDIVTDAIMGELLFKRFSADDD